jgi:CRISPR-associated endonuclease/helicase Cas3
MSQMQSTKRKTNKDEIMLAHVKQQDNGDWCVHDLREHLEEVAKLAAKFGKKFESDAWAKVAGLWHDLGKYRPAFQNYIKKASGYDPEAHIENGRVDHSTAGALHAVNQFGVHGRILAYLISGHHAGLPDWNQTESGNSSLESRLERGSNLNYLVEALDNISDAKFLNVEKPKPKLKLKVNEFHLWIRMLFSCLVDADFLDTEKFMDIKRHNERDKKRSLKELKSLFDEYMKKFNVEINEKTDQKRKTVLKSRASVLRDCRERAEDMPGIFTLTVPTGGGKTLSSMAFALEHAIKHGKDKIIIAIPYTSIIEQTACQYREIFGDAVLEHHSNLDPEQENSSSRLASENWDAPIIVTTNVQLLESLFASRTSRCRKLHNIVNSVLILDEAQLLPLEFLQPTVDVIKSLSKTFGVTVVLSTATQPALTTKKNHHDTTIFSGIDSKKEIISDVDLLFQDLKRVKVDFPKNLNQKGSWEDLVQKILEHPSVLVIVNSRKDARELYKLMPKGTLHLSALMCGQHRTEVISKIKRMLSNNEPIRVISTQLVECGVDFDFPVVFRALSGLDSIAQAAGRCNREGRNEMGEVFVFVPPSSPKKGTLLYREEATKSVCHEGLNDLFSPRAFDLYFEMFFSKENTDKKGINQLLSKDASDAQIQFRTASERYKLIPDSGKTIFIPYGEQGARLEKELKAVGQNRSILRRMQRYCVDVYDDEFHKMEGIGVINEIVPGIWGLGVTNGYDSNLGLLTTEDSYAISSEQSVI